VQYLGPRESAPAHRHTPGAIRFVLEGEGVWTTVDGDACDMAPGDLILTPKWRWHEHCNGGDQPMIWFDGLDLPLTIALDAVFYENYPELTQEIKGHNISERMYGSRGPDTSARITGLETGATSSDLSSPLLVYRRAETDARLKALIGSGQAPMATVPFLNPTNARAVLPTMGCEMHRIAAGKRTPTERRVGSSVWVVFSGRGATVINGQRFDWSRGDIFVVPSWAAVDHLAEERSDLFSINDRPVLEALGLFREAICAEPQRVREVFQPLTTAASSAASSVR
jgi:gentisate 1,2-dioxygenase